MSRRDAYREMVDTDGWRDLLDRVEEHMAKQQSVFDKADASDQKELLKMAQAANRRWGMQKVLDIVKDALMSPKHKND